ncbi:MAG: 2'-5' RNA ligase family protein [Bacteroidota bacterium]
MKPTTQEGLRYFIAIIPPIAIQEKITSLKNQISDHYGSSHALKSPPHITLQMPFRLSEKKKALLFELLNYFNTGLKPFRIALRDFGFFEPRVIYVAVEANQELNRLQKSVAEQCRKQLLISNSTYKERPYHPHITIGFRDLKKKMFYEAKTVFAKQHYGADFLVQRIELIVHEGGRWVLAKDVH